MAKAELQGAPQGITVGGTTVARGQRRRLEIPLARLFTATGVSLAIEVVCGRREGPILWLSAAVHGDELNGLEIVRRVLDKVEPGQLRGTLIAVPVVNVFGFVNQSRYLPDRRDLNRCFPGSPTGSLASRIAHLFMGEVVEHCSHGIDLHTGSNHRTNLPQVRADLRDGETRHIAEIFGAPVLINSQTRDGSLRQAAAKFGKKVIVYEAGEPLRFDADAIQMGVQGVLRVMSTLGMRQRAKKPKQVDSVEIGKSSWVRARQSGIVRMQIELGARVSAKQPLASISDAFGDSKMTVKAPFDGLVIGHTNNPLVHQGDALVHVAQVARQTKAQASA